MLFEKKNLDYTHLSLGVWTLWALADLFSQALNSVFLK